MQDDKGRMKHVEGNIDCNNAPRQSEGTRTPAVRSDDLFKGAREVKLLHGCEEYRLRITKNEKLILTK